MDLENHLDLFKNTPRMFQLSTYPEPKSAYDCWRKVIDNQLHLVKLIPNQINEWYGKDQNGFIGDHKREPSPQSFFEKELEKYTHRKFNEDRIMKADWLNGNYKLYSVQQNFFQENRNKQEHQMNIDSLHSQQYFLAKFKKGKLLGIQEADKNWKLLKKEK